MSGCRAVLFDMDGVIFDSERVLMGCWQELAAAWGYGDVEAVYHRCIGVTTAATEIILKDAYGEDFPWKDFRRQTTARYLEKYSGGRLPVKPGVRELLAFLNGRGVPLALASSTDGALVRRWLTDAGLLDAFQLLVTGDMVQNSKPDPEIFLKACALLGVEPTDSYVIEDSFNGIRAACAGGMHPLMVPDLLPPDGEMAQKAEAVLPDLFAVKDYLEERI